MREQQSKSRKLSAREERFCQLILEGETQAGAYRKAYRYDGENAEQLGHQAFTKLHIAERIAKLRHERSIRSQITADRVLEEIARVAFAKISDVTEWDDEGRLEQRASRDLHDDVKAAVREVKHLTRTIRTKDGSTIEEVERGVKMHDKLAALEKLTKHLGLYEADNSQLSGKVALPPPPDLDLEPEYVDGD